MSVLGGKILTTVTHHTGPLDYTSYFLETKHEELKVTSLGEYISTLAESSVKPNTCKPFLWLYAPAT